MTRPIVRPDWLTRTVEERFNEKWMPEPNSVCWLWTATANTQGYGGFMLNGKREHAQRVAWFLKHGQMPPLGIDVCHRCDTPSCVNPDHLFLGTRRDNMRDAIAKGRKTYVHGIGTDWSKLRRPIRPIKPKCIHGHSLSGSNLYISPQGEIFCKECRRLCSRRIRGVV